MKPREEDTRSRIIEAAGAIFAERGFEKATIRDICALAEVNLASVNYHFGDKERLYAQTIRHAHELATTQVPLPAWPEGTPPEQKLRDFIRTMIHRMRAIRRLPWQAGLMMREFLHPTGVCRELAEDYVRPHFEILVNIIEELTPEDTPPHRRHQLAFSTVGQYVFYHLHAPVIGMLIPDEELNEHYGPEEVADHVADVILAAVGHTRLFPPTTNSAATPAHSE